MTGNSNCFDHFDVPCIPTRHLVSWRFHLCEIKLHCLLFVTMYKYNCFAIVKKVYIYSFAEMLFFVNVCSITQFHCVSMSPLVVLDLGALHQS